MMIVFFIKQEEFPPTACIDILKKAKVSCTGYKYQNKMSKTKV
jgi:hypothetical protein